MEINASPLTWPPAWPRTNSPQASAFGRQYRHGRHTIGKATQEILAHLGRMGVQDWDVIISTNLRYRADGLPYSKQREPEDQGAAIWFQHEGERRVLACDRWDRIADNLWAIAKHLEALRGQERWGVGSMEQAFRGYAALPAGDSVLLTPVPGDGLASDRRAEWWEVLGIERSAGLEEIRQAHRELSLVSHPDLGGDVSRQSNLNRARDIAIAQAAQRGAS